MHRILLRRFHSERVRVSEEVHEALVRNQAVVALESTIISHGMPFPKNVETALEVEKTVRDHEATPATIAVINGTVHVGVERDQMEVLGKSSDARKCSRRDLAWASAMGENGATTVASTMLVAHRAGIRTFVTGGIGGVHRGVNDTWDVSADITELGRTPVTVVCAGVKSILDIPKTLEALETQGVLVAGYRTNEFPAFFSRSSGERCGVTVNTPEEMADYMIAVDELAIDSGAVLAVPNPDPMGQGIEEAIQTAIQEMEAQGVRGKDATPFLLKRVNELTKGRSLESNIALVLNNAKVGAQVARAYAQRVRAKAQANSLHDTKQIWQSSFQPTTPGAFGKRHFSTAAKSPRGASYEFQAGTSFAAAEQWQGNAPILFGSAAVDVIAKPGPKQKLIMHTSVMGVVSTHVGGVGRNIAEAASRLGCGPLLVTALGNDEYAEFLYNAAKQQNITLCNALEPQQDDSRAAEASAVFFDRTEHMPAGAAGPNEGADSNYRTAVYNAFLNEHGDLQAAIADMDCLEAISGKDLEKFFSIAGKAPIAVVDAGLNAEALRVASLTAAVNCAPVWYEPVSVVKSPRLVEGGGLSLATITSPNDYEVLAMAIEVRNALGLPFGDLEDDSDDESDSDAETDTSSNSSTKAGKKQSKGGASRKSTKAPAATAAAAGSDPSVAPGSVNDETLREYIDPSRKRYGLDLFGAPKVEGRREGAAGAEADAAEFDFEDEEEEALAASSAAAAKENTARMEHEMEELLESLNMRTQGEEAEMDLTVGPHVDKKGTFRVASPSGAVDDSATAAASAAHQDMLRQQLGDAAQDTLQEEEPLYRSAVDATFNLDMRILAAAQTVLAGMCLPDPNLPEEVACGALLEGKKHVLVTLGEMGVLWVSRGPLQSRQHAVDFMKMGTAQACLSGEMSLVFAFAPPAVQQNCTGAGDTLVGASCWALGEGKSMGEALRYGMAAAKLSVESMDAVPDTLTRENVEALLPSLPDHEVIETSAEKMKDFMGDKYYEGSLKDMVEVMMHGDERHKSLVQNSLKNFYETKVSEQPKE